MEITVNMSKSELDLIEEALLQYYNILMRTNAEDDLVKSELALLYRVLSEFGIERSEEVMPQTVASPSKRSVILNN
ncbi:MAG: hypothetical protein RLZ12_214 [Bacillota bacterium]|jgi:hypothetical protein